MMMYVYTGIFHALEKRIGMNEFDHPIGILVLLKQQRGRP